MSLNDWMRLIEAFLFPPGLLLLVGLLVWLFGRIQRKWLSRLLFLAIAITWALSTKRVSFWLSSGLEDQFPALRERPATADVVVVLGGGKDPGDNEYGLGSKPTADSFERLVYGAHLARKWSLPLIFSETSTREEGQQGVDSTIHFIKEDLSVPEAYLETRSTTTFENARYTGALMEQLGFSHAVLVTHYSHMPRAIETFHYFNIDVTAAPTGRNSLPWRKYEFLYWVPDAGDLLTSYRVLHEYAGLYWYRFKLFRTSSGSAAH